MGMSNWKTNQLVYIDGQKLSDHNRSPLQVTPEDLNNRERMANGTLRGYTVALKNTWTCSWEDLPSKAHSEQGPVDGGLSGEQLDAYYRNNRKPVELVIKDGAGTSKTYRAIITDFDYSVKKRGSTVDWWDVSITLEEV